MRPGVPRWVRLGLVALGLPYTAAGMWAVIAPHNWFDAFPGWDPRLVAADPPYNAHLASDAGAGLLASGVVLLVGAWLADRRSVTVALVAFSAFSLPHAAYHAINPAPGLTTAEDALNVAVLVTVAVAALALLVGTWRHAGGVVPEPEPTAREERTARRAEH